MAAFEHVTRVHREHAQFFLDVVLFLYLRFTVDLDGL